MHETLIQQGTDLMLYGMGTVFVFLTLLVISVSIMSKIISKFLNEDEIETEAATPASVLKPSTVDPLVLSVIQDAIYQHRAKNQP